MEKPYFASDDLRFPTQTREDVHLGIVRQTRGINSKNASKELRSCHERVRESRALQSVRELKQKRKVAVRCEIQLTLIRCEDVFFFRQGLF